MPQFILKEQRNQIGYTGFYRRPMVEWLGKFVEPTKALLEASLPYGFGLDSLQINTGTQFANQQCVQMYFGLQGNYSCKLDRSEAVFWNLNSDGILRAAEILGGTDAVLRKLSPEWELKSHQFIYSTHNILDEKSVAELLGQFKIPAPKSGGNHTRTAPIFYWEVPDKGWQTQLTVDASQVIPGGVFLSLTLLTEKDRVEFQQILEEGRAYVKSILKELNISFPNES
jgi:hypothetical protein